MKKGNKNSFEFPFNDYERLPEFDIIKHTEGHRSVMFECTNNIAQYSGDARLYQDFHNSITSILKSFQGGYYFQKHDIFSRKIFNRSILPDEKQDFLQEEYFKNFDGKEYKGITTYITITKERKRSLLGQGKNGEKDFINILNKVQTILDEKGFKPHPVRWKDFNIVINRFLGFNFSEEQFSTSNFKVNDTEIVFGRNKFVRSKCLIDNEELDLPNTVEPSTTMNLGYSFPVDLLSFLNEVKDYNELIYHQVIYIPDQKSEITKLDSKKRKHSSMPGASNERSEADIESVEKKIANDKQLVVYAHFNIITSAESFADLNRISNFIDSSVFDFGIIPSRRNDNQFELFCSAIPGNPTELKDYDRFWTTSDPMICFLFKERLQSSENTDFKLYFSDRQGIPISIDTWEQPQIEGRINNRNAFVLGPSGSGKSFLTNHKVRQYARQNVDVVIIDTGHSYEGLCNYQNGRYITYSEENPITMNPFKVNKAEYNEEKREFLKSLISVLWKGTETTLDQVEDSALMGVIKDYYTEYFSHFKELEDGTFKYGMGNKIQEVSFNTFYEYSIERLKEIIDKNKIEFALNNYTFILKKFYKGGQYETILNNELDSSLFDEKFIVFEIDAIKEHKTLFPITTLIIMDVFIQKMRLKSNKKSLIIEEAWKAIASPTMAGHIQYLYKTVRKWDGQVTLVTQELSDILGNETVKDSILGNSDLLYLLDQNKIKDNYDEVAKLLNLNKVEQNKIFTINKLDNKRGRGKFKEVYIRLGSVGQVVAVENSLAEYYIYTTERSEKEALKVYLNVFPKIDRALSAFILDLNKSKMKGSNFVKHINRTQNIFSHIPEKTNFPTTQLQLQ